MADDLMPVSDCPNLLSRIARALTGNHDLLAATLVILAALPAAAALTLVVSAAAADTRLELNYGVTVAGFPVGRAYLKFELNDRDYRVFGAGRTTGIVSLISDGHGKVTAKGTLNDGQPVPAVFTYEATDDDGRETLNMAFSGNRVGKIEIDPPIQRYKLKRRVPLERSHKINVLDPLSALFIPADASKVCNRTLPIFDGEQRFDLVLTHKRIERFRGGKENFKGKVVVCAVSYRPIAGFRPDKKEVVEMQRKSGMEIWMAPIGDTGIMAPISGRLGTSIGPIVISAKRFQLK